jgi:hypothetical protein
MGILQRIKWIFYRLSTLACSTFFAVFFLIVPNANATDYVFSTTGSLTQSIASSIVETFLSPVFYSVAYPRMGTSTYAVFLGSTGFRVRNDESATTTICTLSVSMRAYVRNGETIEAPTSTGNVIVYAGIVASSTSAQPFGYSTLTPDRTNTETVWFDYDEMDINPANGGNTALIPGPMISNASSVVATIPIQDINVPEYWDQAWNLADIKYIPLSPCVVIPPDDYAVFMLERDDYYPLADNTIFAFYGFATGQPETHTNWTIYNAISYNPAYSGVYNPTSPTALSESEVINEIIFSAFGTMSTGTDDACPYNPVVLSTGYEISDYILRAFDYLFIPARDSVCSLLDSYDDFSTRGMIGYVRIIREQSEVWTSIDPSEQHITFDLYLPGHPELATSTVDLTETYLQIPEIVRDFGMNSMKLLLWCGFFIYLVVRAFKFVL